MPLASDAWILAIWFETLGYETVSTALDIAIDLIFTDESSATSLKPHVPTTGAQDFEADIPLQMKRVTCRVEETATKETDTKPLYFPHSRYFFGTARTSP